MSVDGGKAATAGDFTVSLEERGGVACVTVRGRCDVDAAWVAGRCMRTAHDHGATGLVIDLRRVRTTTDAALEAVLHAAGALIASGVDVNVLAPGTAPVSAAG